MRRGARGREFGARKAQSKERRAQGKKGSKSVFKNDEEDDF